MWRRGPHQGGGAKSLTPVTRALIIANVAVFVLQIPFRLKAGMGATDFITNWFGLWPRDVLRFGCVWELATYGFLHSRDIWHIVFNMLLLFWFGRDVELVFGRKRYSVFYFGAVIFGGLCFMLTYAFSPANVVAVGASGAVMAVMVVAAIYWPNRIIYMFFVIPIKLVNCVIIMVLVNLYWLCVMSPLTIAVSAHLGGAAWGAAFVFGARWFSGVGESYERRQRDRASERLADENARLDEILDKVHEQGMHTLTDSEKRFLKRVSQRRREQ